jgi:CheY-like chemotaxis protein
VVDDNLDILALFKRMLLICDPDLEVATAANGPKALETLRAWSPDMVLLDIVMPDMDGWQVLKRKGQDEAIKDIPVILVSAEDMANQPPQSKALVAAMGRGFSISKLLNCSLQLSYLLLSPDSEPVPKPE